MATIRNFLIVRWCSKGGVQNVPLLKWWLRDKFEQEFAELLGTSKQGIGQHIANILNERELDANSVVKKFFTTAADGKKYEVMRSLKG